MTRPTIWCICSKTKSFKAFFLYVWSITTCTFGPLFSWKIATTKIVINLFSVYLFSRLRFLQYNNPIINPIISAITSAMHVIRPSMQNLWFWMKQWLKKLNQSRSHDNFGPRFFRVLHQKVRKETIYGRLHRCWRQVDVGDSMFVTIFGCWWRNFDIGDIFWMLMPDANMKTDISATQIFAILPKLQKTTKNDPFFAILGNIAKILLR